MYFRRKTPVGRAYLQIVESRREGDRVRQQVIATLGRYDELQASGQLERLLRSGARFAAKAMVLSAFVDDSAAKIASHRIGPIVCRFSIPAASFAGEPGNAIPGRTPSERERDTAVDLFASCRPPCRPAQTLSSIAVARYN
jgi:hypothetical protein